MAALRVRPGRPNVLSRSCRSHRLPGQHFSRWSGTPLPTPALEPRSVPSGTPLTVGTTAVWVSLGEPSHPQHNSEATFTRRWSHRMSPRCGEHGTSGRRGHFPPRPPGSARARSAPRGAAQALSCSRTPFQARRALMTPPARRRRQPCACAPGEAPRPFLSALSRGDAPPSPLPAPPARPWPRAPAVSCRRCPPRRAVRRGGEALAEQTRAGRGARLLSLLPSGGGRGQAEEGGPVTAAGRARERRRRGLQRAGGGMRPSPPPGAAPEGEGAVPGRAGPVAGRGAPAGGRQRLAPGGGGPSRRPAAASSPAAAAPRSWGQG